MEKVEQLSYFAVQLCTDETEEIHKRITKVNKAYFAVFHASRSRNLQRQTTATYAS